MNDLTRRELLTALAGTWGLAQRPPPVTSSDDLIALDMVDLIARVRQRKASALEIAEAHLHHIEALNPEISAFITVTADRARADARAIDSSLARNAAVGPLAGAPIAHKDLFETAGIRTTAGSRLYDRYVPRRDADIVRALSRAGVVMLGKTNTHELGGGVTTINPFSGTTHNPWDRSRIPGGSSGGSAAAVAAGMAVAATGSDTGGSVRIPAALCGCVGFKPSFARLSTRGLLGACPTFDHVGLLTRTVADAAVIFGTLVGSATAGRSRVLGIPRGHFFDGLAPDVGRVVEDAIRALRSIAADVRDVSFPIDGHTTTSVFDPIVVSEIQARFAVDWKDRPEAFSPAFADVLRVEGPSAAAVEAARLALAAYRRDVATVFQSVDILVVPTVPMTAPRIEGFIDGGLILRNTWPFNAAGAPALSVPCGFDNEGLPVGLQLVGATGADTAVLGLGRAFQQVTDWHRRRPR
jgi:aspartyl-tRNA(Asn)/glutamyl-tRNA(Gln) amidotransferase subunit A